jgi:hypothetical protein
MLSSSSRSGFWTTGDSRPLIQLVSDLKSMFLRVALS